MRGGVLLRGGGVSCKVKTSKESGGGAPTRKEYGKLLVESSVLFSTNPAKADTLRLFKYVESCRIEKQSLLVAQRKRMMSWLTSKIASACSQVEQNAGGQVKDEFTQCFEMNDFYKTYELLGSTIITYA